MANYVNRIIAGAENTGQNQNVAGRFDAVTGAEGRQNQTAAVANAADELMNQLLDDRNETNLRSNSAMITQALKEAGLPANATNTAIVNALLRGNMPISRESIRSTLAEVRAYPQLDADALVSMRRADIPINSESAATVREFLDNTAIITNDVNALADMVENLLTSPATSTETADAIRLAIYDAARSAVMSENAAATGSTGSAAAEASIAAGNVTTEVASAASSALAGMAAVAPAIEAEQLPYRIVIEPTPTALPDEPATEGGGETAGSAVSGRGAMAGEELAGSVAGEGPAAGGEAAAQAVQAAEGEALPEQAVSAQAESAAAAEAAEDPTGRYDYSFRNFEELVAASSQEADGSIPKANTAAELPEAFKELTPAQLKHLLKTSLSISARDLSKETVRDMYERTAEFTSKIKEATEHSPEHAALNAKASQTAQDLNLLNNLNRVYPHIELPLRFENSEAEGGLYVYTNKRSKASATDPVTALLHLNMPSLGPIDIHLSLKDRYLGMNFYTDDDAGRLLAGDITYLRERLEHMDYSMFARFNPKEALEQGVKSSMGEAPGRELPKAQPERLSFDIRA